LVCCFTLPRIELTIINHKDPWTLQNNPPTINLNKSLQTMPARASLWLSFFPRPSWLSWFVVVVVVVRVYFFWLSSSVRLLVGWIKLYPARWLVPKWLKMVLSPSLHTSTDSKRSIDQTRRPKPSRNPKKEIKPFYTNFGTGMRAVLELVYYPRMSKKGFS
jgi:hypothetical protein